MYAQEQKDVITLTNGKQIVGRIVETNPGESVKIESKGLIFDFKWSEIEKIEKQTEASGIEPAQPVIREAVNVNTAVPVAISATPVQNGNWFGSFQGGGGYFSYENDDEFKIANDTKTVEFDGSFVPSFGLAADCIFPGDVVAVGGAFNISYISGENKIGYIPLSQYHDSYSDWNIYFENFNVSYDAIPITLDIKISFLPYKVFSPNFGIGLSVINLSQNYKGNKIYETTYDDDLNLSIDETFSQTINGLHLFGGFDINFNNYVSLTTSLDYSSATAKEKTTNVPHRDVIIGNDGYYEYILYSAKIESPENIFAGMMIKAGLKFKIGVDQEIK